MSTDRLRRTLVHIAVVAVVSMNLAVRATADGASPGTRSVPDPTPIWTDQVQAIAAVCTAAITLIGFAFLYSQIAQAKRSLNGATHAALYAQEQAINELFVLHLEFREYFYGGRECPGDDPHRAALLAIADMLTDFLEHISQQRGHLPRGIWPAWVRYMRSMCETSPLLREQLTSN